MVTTYFLKLDEKRKLKPEEIKQALIGKIQSAQSLINLLTSPFQQDASVLNGLRISRFGQSVTDFDEHKELWHEYHHQLLTHSGIQA